MAWAFAIVFAFALTEAAQVRSFREGRERARGVIDQVGPDLPQPELPRGPYRPGVEAPVRIPRICRNCGNEFPDHLGPDDTCPFCGTDYRSALIAPLEGTSTDEGTDMQVGLGNGRTESGGYSLWETNPGHTLIHTVLGALLAAIFGALIWAIRVWRREQLENEYWEAVRPAEHSLSRIMRKRKGEAIDQSDANSMQQPPSPIQWLLGRGLEGLEREIVKARSNRRSCATCRYAASGGPVACPHAFACGALRHPRASVAHALLRGLSWFGFALVVIAIIAVVMAFVPARPGSRPLPEVMWLSAPGLLALAMLAGGTVFVWNLWSALSIRRQVRVAAQTADLLQLEFLNFRKVPLETGALAFPLMHPGDVTKVHLVMHGQLKRKPLVVAYYEYEMSERDGRGNDWERQAAVARGWMGKEMHFSWGQLVIMFPESIPGIPNFQISPVGDIDYYLLRESKLISAVLKNTQVVRQYCITSRDPAAGRLIDETFQQFLIDNPGWNVQSVAGRLMLWRGKFDVLSAEIAPANQDRLVADLETAVQWRELLALRRQSTVASEGLSRVEARDAQVLGEALTAFDNGNIPLAERLLLSVIADTPNNYANATENDDGSLSIRFWDEFAFVHYVTWQRERGINRAVHWIPNVYPRAYYYLGFLRVQAEKYEEALKALDRGQRLEPTNPRFLLEKSQALLRAGRQGEAFDICLSITECGPFVSAVDVATACRSRGFIQIERGRLDLAEREFRTSLKLQPGNEVALNELEYIEHLRRGGRAAHTEITSSRAPSLSRCAICGESIEHGIVISIQGIPHALCERCHAKLEEG
jgi:tetratricopeptide (TPR) repeat protein